MKLTEDTIEIDKLLLDPNNPRFNTQLGETTVVAPENYPSVQSELLSRFKHDSDTQSDDEDEDGLNTTATGIKDLYESMFEVGFVGIDGIVVEQLDNGLFLVLEGNRRVATAKTLLKHFNASTPQGKFENDDIRENFPPERIASLTSLPVQILDLEGLTSEEKDKRIAVVLGIRHHGSLLEWGPLPKAFNIYKEYLEVEPQQETFAYKRERVVPVAATLSIPETQVRRALKAYVAYRQLANNFPVKPRHYSLIHDGVNNSRITSNLIESDRVSFELDAASLDKMNHLCQFETRDNPNQENILKRPQSWTLLATLYQQRGAALTDGIRDYVQNQIDLVVEEGEQHLETAVDLVKSRVREATWPKLISRRLDQAKKLNPEDFGSGNDMGYRDRLKESIRRVEAVLDALS